MSTCGLCQGLCFLYEDLRDAVKAEKNGIDGFSTDKHLKLYYYLFQDAHEFLKYSTTFLTFILGFFNSVAFSRWWKFRDLTGVVLGKTTDTAVMFSTYVTEGDEQGREDARRDLLRLLVLAVEVHLQDAHRVVDFEIKRMVDRNLLSVGTNEYNELDSMKSSRYSVVYGWLMHRFSKAVEDGYVSPKIAPQVRPSCLESYRQSQCQLTLAAIRVSAMCILQVLQFVQENVSKMRGACADVKMYQNQQIPLPYVHLLELLVTVYLILAPAALVPQLLWVAPFVSCFVTLFFYGFFVLGTKILLDPFSSAVSVRTSYKALHPVVRGASDLVAYSIVLRYCWQPEEGGFDTSAFFEDTVTVLEAVNARIPLDSPHIENRMVRSASVPPIFANRGSGLEAAIEANQASEAKQEEQKTFRQRGALRRASVPG